MRAHPPLLAVKTWLADGLDHCCRKYKNMERDRRGRKLMDASYLADCCPEKEIYGVQLSLCVRTEEEGDKRVSGRRANG